MRECFGEPWLQESSEVCAWRTGADIAAVERWFLENWPTLPLQLPSSFPISLSLLPFTVLRIIVF